MTTGMKVMTGNRDSCMWHVTGVTVIGEGDDIYKMEVTVAGKNDNNDNLTMA